MYTISGSSRRSRLPRSRGGRRSEGRSHRVPQVGSRLESMVKEVKHGDINVWGILTC
jgi:hypothetical protein